MGFTPQFVDLDGDGVGDILTGSWPGEIYFFKGKGHGEFAAAVKLQRNGKDINLGSASTVFAADWRGTGRFDLLIGNIDGAVYLFPNDGTNASPVYGTVERLEADGQPIKVPHGDSQPIVADWDHDGLPDLLIGCGDGSVVWHRNVGTKTKPKLAKGVPLVQAAPPTNHDEDAPPTKGIKPGMRAKACVVDWNGDGQLDLLVGDFAVVYGEKPKLSEADKKLQKETNDQLLEVQNKLEPFYQQYSKQRKWVGQGDDSAEAKRERQKKAEEVLNQKECQELQAEMRRLYGVLSKFQRPYTYQGNVWLYLRKPPAAANSENAEARPSLKR